MEENTNAKNKYILVAGASSGLGAACLTALLKEGYKVIGIARRKDRIESLLNNQDDSFASSVDVTKEEEVITFCEDLKKRNISLGGLVYCSGINSYAEHSLLSQEVWERIYAVNVFGAASITRHLQSMLPKGSRIVLIGSTAGKRPFEYGTAYCSSKTAMHGFAEALREELRPLQISVTLFVPGSMPTEFFISPRKDASELLPVDYAADLICNALRAPSHCEVSEMVVRPMKEL